MPIAQAGAGHPDVSDRSWFNGDTDDLAFAVAYDDVRLQLDVTRATQ